MKIYTKTGDAGETGLWGGLRIAKDAARVQAYGTVDECNAAIGVARASGVDVGLDAILARIQDQLFVVGADLVARTVLPQALPVGILTAALGAPWLLWLLVRGRRRSTV